MKLKLGKTATSRTRAKVKEPEIISEVQKLGYAQTNLNTGFMDYLLQKGYSLKTADRYFKDVNKFESWTEKENVPLESASYNDILHYIQYKKKKVQQITVMGFTNSLKHYYSFLELNGTIADNPVTQITIKGVRRKKLYDILTRQELEGLYHNYQSKEDKATGNQNWYKMSQLVTNRNKVIIGLLVYQGLNATELTRLTVKDVKLREGKIFIAGTRKSNERELILEAVQMLDLMEYVLKTRTTLQTLTGKQSEQLLLSSGAGESLNNALYKLMQQIKLISSKASSIKQIRTSVITHWLKQYNLRQVQYMAGHRYVSSTEAYLINDLEDLLDDITKFHPIG